MADASPTRSPRRPLTLDDKSAMLSPKITGAEGDRQITVGEASRISHQNQLRRSCLESTAVPVFTSFSKDSAAYNLTVNFKNQSSRRHDDPRFRMYKALIKHPDAFALPEREVLRRRMIEEIGTLAAVQNVTVTYDEASPRISPRQTLRQQEPVKSPKKSSSTATTPRRGDKEKERKKNDGGRAEEVAEAFAVPTFIASEYNPNDDDGGSANGGSPPYSSADEDDAMTTPDSQQRQKKLRATKKKTRVVPPSINGFGGSGRGGTTKDRMPDIITPRHAHPRTRIEEQLRTRETIISEVMGAGAGSSAQSTTTTVPPIGGPNNRMSFSARPPQQQHLLSSSGGNNSQNSKPSFRSNNSNGAEVGNAPAPTAPAAVIPPTNPMNRRQSLAVPVIAGGSAKITEAAKEIARRQQRPAKKSRSQRGGPNLKGLNNNGAGGRHRSGSKKKKNGSVLLDDSINSNPSENYDDIPLFEVDDGGYSSGEGDWSSTNEYSDDDSDAKTAKSSASATSNQRRQRLKQQQQQKKSKSSMLSGKRSNTSATTTPKSASLSAPGGILKPTFNDSPVAIAAPHPPPPRSFHLKTAAAIAPKPPKKGRRGSGADEPDLLDATTAGLSDQMLLLSVPNADGAGRPLSRLRSGINIEIPLGTGPALSISGGDAFASPLAPAPVPMPAPQRGVAGGSVLTVRDQIMRSVGQLPSGGSNNAMGGGGVGESFETDSTSNPPPLQRLATATAFNFSASKATQQPAAATTTLSSNWCLTQPRQEATRESTQTAVVSALSTPRAVRDLFASGAQIGGGGAMGQGGGSSLSGGGHMMGGSNAASARASFYQNGTLSFANMRRGQQSFAGFGIGGGGGGGARKPSAMLAFSSTYNTFGSTYNTFLGGGGSEMGSNYDLASEYGGGGGGGYSSHGGLLSGSASAAGGGGTTTESALIHVMPPVIFRGLTSSGAGGAMQTRRKRTMNVAYGGAAEEGQQQPPLGGSAGSSGAAQQAGAGSLDGAAAMGSASSARGLPRPTPPMLVLPPKNPLKGRGRPADGSLSARL